MRHARTLGGLLIAILLAGCGASGNSGTAFPSPDASLPAATTPPEESPVALASAPPQQSPAALSPSVSAQSSAAPASAAASSGAAPTVFDPAGVQIGLEEVASGFEAPVFVGNAGDGSGRVFVVEKGGRVLTLDGDVLLDISDRVNDGGSEQGLLGLAFHPDFEQNGYLYVAYTDENGNHAISRFTAQGDSADPASESFVLQVEDPAGNHNGGMLAFGPDGYLYIGFGDGGGAGDTYGNGQNAATLLGKLLRLDVDQEPYAVPEDNPFVGQENVRGEIFSYGLRNPWRFSFDRETSDLYIGDVGQNQYEWLHVRPAGEQGGENFGWPILEGRSCFRESGCDRNGITEAVVDYPHSEGCSVVGGYVYRGQQYPALRGGYVFGDYCSGNMWTMSQGAEGWTLTPALQAEAGLSSFGEDEAGELYVSNLRTGTVFRVTGTPR